MTEETAEASAVTDAPLFDGAEHVFGLPFHGNPRSGDRHRTAKVTLFHPAVAGVTQRSHSGYGKETARFHPLARRLAQARPGRETTAESEERCRIERSTSGSTVASRPSS